MVPPSPPRDDDDLDEPTDELSDEQPEDTPEEPAEDRPRAKPVASRPGRSGRRSPASRSEPVRRWRGSSESADAWEDDLDDGETSPRKRKRPVFWRARDSLYFEPLVALAILAVLLVSLYAYTSNWPPVYVVESNSMQHGSGDHLGVLNAGDIVLAEKVGSSQIVPYVQAIGTGYTTYGEYGDVLLYYPNGSTSLTPIIHRAIIYLQYDPHSGTYNATGLSSTECGNGSGQYYATPGTSTGCATTGLTTTDTLFLYHIGGRTVTVDLARLATTGSTHSGYLTLGDNNSNPDQLTSVFAPLSTLVEPGWVIGVARGMIPWFGALKLLLDGNAGKVPQASWEFLGLTIAGVIFAAAGVHLLFRRQHQRERWRASRDEEQEEVEDREERPPSPKSAPERTPVRPWQAAPPPVRDVAEPAAPRRMSYEQRRRAHFVSSHEQRPSRRRPPARKRPEDDDEA